MTMSSGSPSMPSKVPSSFTLTWVSGLKLVGVPMSMGVGDIGDDGEIPLTDSIMERTLNLNQIKIVLIIKLTQIKRMI